MLDLLEFILKLALILTSLFMIGLVLIQRGKGGGLAGAFGATGGSSAFGTKSGDVFTRITITTGGIWILMSMLLVVVSNSNRGTSGSVFGNASEGVQQVAPGESRSKTVIPRSGEATQAIEPEAPTSAPKSVSTPAVPAPLGAGQPPERPVAPPAGEPKK
ncbi:MAG: preprotein translocase subunit SecG [bacterium]